MLNLVRSEILKVRSTQVWFWMLIVAIALTTLFTLGPALSVHSGTPKEEIDYYGIFTASGLAGVALLVLGLLALTTEFRHKTITPSLLAAPNRWRFLAGKTLAYVLLAIPYGLVSIAVNIVLAIICLNAKGLPVSFGDGVPAGILKAFVSLILLAFFGIGLGALLRNQAAGMVAGIVYLFVLSPILGVIPWVRRARRGRPGGALQYFNSKSSSNAAPYPDVPHVAPLIGGVILLLWCVGILEAGGYLSLKRDIS
jgi:ABC-2 type transport system permease protein